MSERDAVQRQGAGGLGQRVLCRQGRPTGGELVHNATNYVATRAYAAILSGKNVHVRMSGRR